MATYRPDVSNVTVTVDTSIYAAGDSLSTAAIDFQVQAMKGLIRSVTIVDPDHNTAANLAGNLWLFAGAVTPAAANAAHDITDAHAAKCIGIIPVVAGDAQLSASNTVASAKLAQPLPYSLEELPSGASVAAHEMHIYGIYVVGATPTFAGASVRFKLGYEFPE